jgi:hypothetical protein
MEGLAMAFGKRVGPISERGRPSVANGCVARAFLWIFILIGAVFFWFFAARPFINVMESRSWAEVPCVILSSAVRTHDGDDGDTYSIEVAYEYTHGGQTYQGDRYHFFTGSSSGYKGKARVVERLAPGTETVCYVNPENPSESVLVRGFTPVMLLGLIPLVFVLTGFLGLFALMRSESRAARLPEARSAATGPGSPDGMSPWRKPPRVVAGGWYELQPDISPLGKFVGFLLAALLWNGIVGTVLFLMYRSGDAPLFAMLIIGLFQLIGLGIVAGAVMQGLALFNPRPIVTVSAGAWVLGETGGLRWEIRGGGHRLASLKITLEGEESARYRRGTDTVTDKEVFQRIPLADTREPREIAAGSVEVPVPPDTMHTFEAPNNSVKWKITLRGEITGWPDIEADYPVILLPHAAREV